MLKREYFRSRRFIILSLIVILIIVILILLAVRHYSSRESFSTDIILLKTNIMLGGESVSSIKIINNEKSEQNFEISLNNLVNIAYINETNLVVSGRDSKKIEVHFKDTLNSVNVYAGELVIKSSSKYEKRIPIIVNIEYKASPLVIIQKIIPSYQNVYPAGKLGMDIKIFYIDDNEPHNININYIIKDFNDKVLFSEEDEQTIEGSLRITKIVDIPKTFLYGDYVFITSAEYNQRKSSSGYLFSVSKKVKGVIFGSFDILIVLTISFILLIIILFFYFVKTRDDLLTQVRKKQYKELKKNLSLIKQSKLAIKDIPAQEKELKKLDEMKQNIIKRFKIRKERQEEEINRLRESGRKEEIKRKLESWESEERTKLFETELIKQRLTSQLELLKRTYSEGHISKKSYEKGKERIIETIKRLNQKI